MAILIRQIEAKDNPRIAEIIKSVMISFDCVGEGYSIEDAEVNNMFDAYANAKSKYYVISLNDKIEGGAGIGPLLGGEDTTCELKKMYFTPELRGRGIGKKILTMLLADAKDLGYSDVYLETVERMETANHLYKSFGFQKLCSHEGCTGHSGCDSYYKLHLE